MFLPDQVYSIYNQGINRQPIFHKRDDYIHFLSLYIDLFKNTASTIAWNLMPDHFHFLVRTNWQSAIEIQQGGLVIDTLTNSIRKLLSNYAQWFNNKYKRTGSLFRQKTRSKCLSLPESSSPDIETTEEKCKNCFYYINTNPVTAGLVEGPGDWEFSSFNEYSGIKRTSICDKETATVFCGYNPSEFEKTARFWMNKFYINQFR